MQMKAAVETKKDFTQIIVRFLLSIIVSIVSSVSSASSVSSVSSVSIVSSDYGYVLRYFNC